MKGTVYLVGAGPGDPGLITLKAVERLKKADTVIYDRLVNPKLLAYAPKNAELIYAGKAAKNHTLSQDKINRLLLKKARQKKTVVRLKCGDPFIFGRGAEEALFLARHKVPFEVVPGLSSALASPAYAGIPLTHRDYTSSLGIFTGHQAPDKGSPSIDWEKISSGLGTLVFLMGVENLSFITKNLIKSGRDKNTPCCLIQEATLPRQKSVQGTLSTIVQKAEAARIRPPAILVIGEVVSLRKNLNWFEDKPLWGKKILITRPQEGDNRLSQILEDYGAECRELPAIKIQALKDYSRLDAAIKNLSSFNWIIFSSQNGVRFFKDRLRHCSASAGNNRLKFAVIGPRTASALEEIGLRAGLQPDKFCQEGLLGSFEKLKIKGQNILIINALEARDVLARGLERMGADVSVAPAYQTVSGLQSSVSSLLLNEIDIITFTSSLAAKSFLTPRIGKMLSKGRRPLIASIGPITSRAIKDAGIRVDIEARKYTLEGLAEAIIKSQKAKPKLKS